MGRLKMKSDWHTRMFNYRVWPWEEIPLYPPHYSPVISLLLTALQNICPAHTVKASTTYWISRSVFSGKWHPLLCSSSIVWEWSRHGRHVETAAAASTKRQLGCTSSLSADLSKNRQRNACLGITVTCWPTRSDRKHKFQRGIASVWKKLRTHTRRVGLERSRPLWNNRALMGCG